MGRRRLRNPIGPPCPRCGFDEYESMGKLDVAVVCEQCLLAYIHDEDAMDEDSDESSSSNTTVGGIVHADHVNRGKPSSRGGNMR